MGRVAGVSIEELFDVAEGEARVIWVIRRLVIVRDRYGR